MTNIQPIYPVPLQMWLRLKNSRCPSNRSIGTTKEVTCGGIIPGRTVRVSGADRVGRWRKRILSMWRPFTEPPRIRWRGSRRRAGIAQGEEGEARDLHRTSRFSFSGREAKKTSTVGALGAPGMYILKRTPENRGEVGGGWSEHIRSQNRRGVVGSEIFRLRRPTNKSVPYSRLHLKFLGRMGRCVKIWC